MGDTVNVDYRYPNLFSVEGPIGTAVVTAAGTTFTYLPLSVPQNRSIYFLVTDNTVTVTTDYGIFANPAAFNGFGIHNLSAGTPAITGVTLDPSSPAFDLSRVTFNATDVYIKFQGLNDPPGFILELDLQSTATPEPATLLLLISGACLIPMRPKLKIVAPKVEGVKAVNRFTLSRM